MRGVAARVFVFALAAACASKSQHEELDDPDVAGHTTAPDGTPYPENVGSHPRTSGVAGDAIPNLTFRGYLGSDKAAGLKTVSLADYYDPKAVDHKVLFIAAAATWCAICDNEAREMVRLQPALRKDGAILINVLVNGVTSGFGPSQNELDRWVDEHQTTYDVLVDVRARRLITTMNLGGVPWVALIDTRTMEILHASDGSPDDLEAYVRLGIDFVDKHPR